MSIHPVAAGWQIDYRDEFGRRRRRTVTTEAAAQAIEARLRETSKNARQAVIRFEGGEKLTIEESAALYTRRLYCGKTRREKLLGDLNAMAKRIGNPPASQVTPQQMQAYAEMRESQVAPSTAAKQNGDIKAFFAWLREEHIIAANPAEKLNTKQQRASTGIEITTAEEEALLNRTQTAPTRLKTLLALDAGLRISEIISLRGEAWNQGDQTLTVYSAKNRSTRTIPLTRRLTNQLKEANPRPTRQIIKPGGDTRSATAFMRKYGAAPRFHDLRHTFGTRIARASNANIARTLLGHSPRSTTELYLHPSLDDCRKAVAAMESANPLSTESQAEQRTQAQQNPERRNEEMPGKRFNLRIKGKQYGPLNGERARAAEDQSGASEGTTWVIPMTIEARILVKLTDLEIIEQKSTTPQAE